MKKPPAEFLVRVALPLGVDRRRMAQYIREAVQVWRGGTDPNDPLFDLDPETVKVKALPATAQA